MAAKNNPQETQHAVSCLDMQPGTAPVGDRRQHWGAVPGDGGEWHFAIWAPSAREVVLELGGPCQLDPPSKLAPFPRAARYCRLARGDDGTFRCRASGGHGTPYAFIVDGTRVADPASRWQAGGVDSASRLLDPAQLRGVPGPQRPLDEAVISEIHVGSFTPEGTFAAAARAPQLAGLAGLGITMIELMPLGQFPGRRGWGYDSVLPWSPHHAYGEPADLRRLIDTAHDLGLQVCLDVVFNHFGPEGCALIGSCPEFFHDHSNDWGRAINFERPEVRAYFTDCAIWWLEVYGFDALRFDALHAMVDDDDPPMIEAMARAIRAHPFGRPVHLMAEDSRNHIGPYRPGAGLYDAVWKDDYHHAQHVLLTGEHFGYYRDFRQTPLDDMARALREGFALQGQKRAAGQQAKGEPSADLPAQSFVAFNLNHDHAGNRPKGERLLTLIGQDKALIAHALLLTAPSIPLLFMGEEVGSEAPFPWFGDYADELAEAIARGRARDFAGTDSPAGPMVDPFDPATQSSACPYATRAAGAAQWEAATRCLTRLRRQLLPIYRSPRLGLPQVRVAEPSALAARFDHSAGSVSLVACFAAHDHIAGQDRPTPLLQFGQPGRSPFFALWRDLKGDDHNQ